MRYWIYLRSSAFIGGFQTAGARTDARALYGMEEALRRVVHQYNTRW